jgi:hypothetical protein
MTNKKLITTICKSIFFLFFVQQAVAQNKIEVEFKTGEDDLAIRDAGIQRNLKITIQFKTGATALVLENANNNQNWPKNSIRRVSIPLAADVDVNNLALINLNRGTTSNNFEDAVADNWDLKSLLVTAIIKRDGVTAKYRLLTMSGNPLNRFKAGINCNCDKTYNFSNPVLISGTQPWIDNFPAPQTSAISAVFGNGGDDLRGGNDNVKIVITFKNSTRKLIYNNVNEGAKWENFTEKSVSKTLPGLPGLTIADIKEVELWHTGGGGMAADNWDLDKFKLTITINGATKTLVDRVGAPLHRFTGDTRRKTFVVE